MIIQSTWYNGGYLVKEKKFSWYSRYGQHVTINDQLRKDHQAAIWISPKPNDEPNDGPIDESNEPNYESIDERNDEPNDEPNYESIDEPNDGPIDEPIDKSPKANPLRHKSIISPTEMHQDMSY